MGFVGFLLLGGGVLICWGLRYINMSSLDNGDDDVEVDGHDSIKIRHGNL